MFEALLSETVFGLARFRILHSKEKTAQTSLNMEVRPFLLCDTSIWSFPFVSSLSDYSVTAFGGPAGI